MKPKPKGCRCTYNFTCGVCLARFQHKIVGPLKYEVMYHQLVVQSAHAHTRMRKIMRQLIAEAFIRNQQLTVIDDAVIFEPIGRTHHAEEYSSSENDVD